VAWYNGKQHEYNVKQHDYNVTQHEYNVMVGMIKTEKNYNIYFPAKKEQNSGHIQT
jgi:hypothetical protein